MLKVAITKSDTHKTGLLMSIKVRSKAKTAASYFGASSLMGKAMSAVMVVRHRCRFKPYRSDAVVSPERYSRMRL